VDEAKLLALTPENQKKAKELSEAAGVKRKGLSLSLCLSLSLFVPLSYSLLCLCLSVSGCSGCPYISLMHECNKRHPYSLFSQPEKPQWTTQRT